MAVLTIWYISNTCSYCVNNVTVCHSTLYKVWNPYLISMLYSKTVEKIRFIQFFTQPAAQYLNSSMLRYFMIQFGLSYQITNCILTKVGEV